MKRYTPFVLVALILLIPAWASALPRMSLTAGTPCSACHVNMQGGGGRTEIGWGSMAYNGAFTYEDMGFSALAEQETNTFSDGAFSLGMDIRLQMAKFGAPRVARTGDVVPPERRVIPMQIQPYLAIFPTDWLKLYGTYAVGPATFDGKLCDPTYAGQSCFEAEAIIQPSYSAPAIRIGQIQPSIGIRHDDHTMLVRGDASAPRVPIIAPNYAELGAELTYTPKYWFSTETGIFRAKNLSEAIANTDVVTETDAAWVGRIQFAPRIKEDWPITTYIGTSLYLAGQFQMENYFLGLGWLDNGSLMFEVSRSNRGDDVKHETLNMMTMLSVQAKEWLIVEARYERAKTTLETGDATTHSAVLGLQFFPIPYVELRPEYRYLRTDDYAMGQYTLQVHMFY